MRAVAAWGALLLLVLGLPVQAADPIEALLRAYPDALARSDGADLLWRDGTRMAVDAAVLAQARADYRRSTELAQPERDPGRIRDPAFFDKMYGDCRTGAVAPDLVRIVWLPRTWGHTISITSVNGVDRQLAAISRELDALPAEDKRFLYPIGGTYNCRAVADTGGTSMHAWGAAIDINPAYADYWFWRPDRAYVNRIPLAIVAIFERHGFIWGGRWLHFDTMHFEYRPELLRYNPAADE